MWTENIRTFAPGLKNFVVGLLCLQSVALALMVNSTVALALVAALSACLIKIYQINPEPILLLLTHTAISSSMLYDPITTFAIIIIVVAAVVTFGDYDLPTERVVVFIMSIATTAIFGKVTACVASIAIGVIIIMFKFRPIQPPALCLLGLGSIGLTLFVNGLAGGIVVSLFIAALTGLFIINKKLKKRDPPPDNSTEDNKPAHPNGYLPLSNPTESLDLHGHTVTGAMKVLHAFLKEHEEEYRQNRVQHIRHVTVITGDGTHSSPHDAANLVKPTVVNYLKINKYKYEVPSDSPGIIKVDLESHAL